MFLFLPLLHLVIAIAEDVFMQVTAVDWEAEMRKDG